MEVPNLTYRSALKFSRELWNHNLQEEESIDFSRVQNCDPFPMLLTAAVIRQRRKACGIKRLYAQHCNNSYAEHMRFYTACGINKGRGFDENYGNNNYLPITRLDMNELKATGAERLERIQEILSEKARDMAKVLARENVSFANWLSYVLTEMMRNVPEHSHGDAIWYCAQYWPLYDLIELAFLDEGIGIRNSLLSNRAYEDLLTNDEEAIHLALQPGVSRTFAPGSANYSDDEWKNSGYGLYMVSRLCDRLGGSFILASGKSALLLKKGKFNAYACNLKGTAIQIRITASKIQQYKEVAREILRKGEEMASKQSCGITAASKSTKSLFSFED